MSGGLGGASGACLHPRTLAAGRAPFGPLAISEPAPLRLLSLAIKARALHLFFSAATKAEPHTHASYALS